MTRRWPDLFLWHQLCPPDDSGFSGGGGRYGPELTCFAVSEVLVMPHSRLPERSSETIPAELRELQAAVADLPEPHRARLQKLVERVVEYTRRRREVLLVVQEALAQLRLDMKYLVFDLEATRRERDAYRRLLEGNR